MTEKEFFKAMEAGKLMSADVLPKLTKQMAKVARENGALEKAMQSVNSEQQRFYTSLTLAKKELFEGGFGEGMADLFGSLSISLTNMMPALRLFGGVMKGALAVVTSAVQIALSPFEAFSALIKGLDLKGIGSVVGATGTLALLALRFSALRNLILGVNFALLATVKRLVMLAAPLLIIEDVLAHLSGKDTYTTDFTQKFSRSSILSADMNKRIDGVLRSIQRSSVDVNVNTTGVKELVEVTVNNQDQSSRANALAQLGG